MRTNFRKSLMVMSIVAALVGSASLIFAEDYANPQLLVETTELTRLLNDPNVRIVDVRTRESYAEGHLPNAVHLGADDIIDPSSHINGELRSQEELAKMLGERGIGRDTHVILYDDRGGFHAARLFWMLEYFGHRDVGVLNGGFPKWEKEGREVVTEVPTVASTFFPIDLTPRKHAAADWILEREYDPSVVVVDVRPTGLYRDGHIPWARNIPWSQNLTSQQTLKSADALEAHFERNGVTKNKNVVVHCQVGKAAAHSYFTLRLLGYPRIRSYDRSWAEWGTANDLPKATGSGN